MPNFIEVCAGSGGLSSGLIRAGFHPLLINDIDANCCKTLTLNHPNVRVECGSLTNIDFSGYKGKVDLFVGGVPCQSFSQAGKRKGLEDERGGLIVSFIKIVHQILPKLFMIENVKGLISHKKGETFKNILAQFNSDLYDVKYKVLNSVYFGVPQKRERVFIVGCLKKENLSFQFPKEDKKNQITVGDALKEVPQSPGYSYSEEKKRLFEMIPEGGCWINLPENLQRSYLGNSFHSGGGKRGILHRLSLQKPCLTLLCSPSQKQTERCHPKETRPLTIREYARIQTFPDNYQFYGSISSQYKQIGNAVPVELAYRIGQELMKTMIPKN